MCKNICVCVYKKNNEYTPPPFQTGARVDRLPGCTAIAAFFLAVVLSESAGIVCVHVYVRDICSVCVIHISILIPLRFWELLAWDVCVFMREP